MISVIIPTYNRSSILRLCLEQLAIQERVDFEVIVVDDGSVDETKAVVHEFILRNNPNWQQIRYFFQANAGQGAARNLGAREAKGQIVLFLGDDILPIAKDFLDWHARTHEQHPDENVVVLGHSTWDTTLEINDYMRFLESSGWQFGYGFLKPGFVTRSDPWKFFYTSNLSLKKSFFQKAPFDESFRAYGWEDIEVGYRLWKDHGMRLFYEPKAAAHHRHLISEKDLSERMRRVGLSAAQFQKLHPELRILPAGIKRLLIRGATWSPSVNFAKLFSRNLHFKLSGWKEFMKGAEEKNGF